jgi:hypothetical protein
MNAYLPVNYLHDKYGNWFARSFHPRQEFSSRLRIAGAKIFADRAAPKTFLSQPHTDNPGYHGEVYRTQNELSDVVQQLHAGG